MQISYDPALDVENLLQFALESALLQELDVPDARNALLHTLHLDKPAAAPTLYNLPSATPLLERLLDYAAQHGLIPEDTQTQRDLLDTRLMGCLMPRPSEVAARFERLRAEQCVRAACEDFYRLCIRSGYVRAERVARNTLWHHDAPFARLQITINLSKPEKDPREIEKLKHMPAAGYPKCQLCLENVGYPGRLDHPARQTLRVIPMTLGGEPWFMQYSPYVYYNEHCIVLSRTHADMRVSRTTFERLFDFLDIVPHYFIGSNADLPIVGGSILNHDHFQGGNHTLPMATARAAVPLSARAYPDVDACLVDWPMSTLRLRSRNRYALVQLADRLLSAWRGYDAPAQGIRSHTGDTPHNTITPIARMRDGQYELDLVLRCNITSAEHPLGVFHPHDDLHHIKRENIGLIEVMGLFILPGRLQSEYARLAQALCAGAAALQTAQQDEALAKHAPWAQAILHRYGTPPTEQDALTLLHQCTGEVCERILHDCGVFKSDAHGREGFLAFLQSAGISAR